MFVLGRVVDAFSKRQVVTFALYGDKVVDALVLCLELVNDFGCSSAKFLKVVVCCCLGPLVVEDCAGGCVWFGNDDGGGCFPGCEPCEDVVAHASAEGPDDNG